MSAHEPFMDRALLLAQEALARGDWPVAAVIAKDGNIIAEGQARQASRDPTWHAEIDVLRTATDAGLDVSGATLYCTMEPCPMCAWAVRLSGIGQIVLGARHADLRRIDLGDYSLEKFAALMGYRCELVEGVRHRECIELRQRWGKDQVASCAR